MHRHHLAPARALLAACALALAPTALAQTSNDSILSRHVREADGTSLQDTNSGSGIKTGHLQNGAVTAPKLAPQAVGTSALADGAVTAAKLAGAIPAAKIDATGLNADTVDGLHAASFAAAAHGHDDVYAKKLRNVLVVSADGKGDFTDPVAAVNSITDASATNPYLVKVAPGDYVASTALVMKPFVDLAGSGQGVTRLVVYAPGMSSYVTAFQFKDDSEVRDVTLESTDLLNSAGVQGRASLRNVTIVRNATKPVTASFQSAWVALLVEGAGGVLDHVSVVARVADGANPGAGVGVRVWVPTTMRDCEVSVTAATATGIFVYRNGGAVPAELDLAGSRVSAVATDAAGDATAILPIDTFRARGSRLEAIALGADGRAFGLNGGGPPSEIQASEIVARTPNRATPAAWATWFSGSLANTKADGAIFGPPRCFGVYDASYAPVTCQ